jgi:hypothetical protein
LGGAETAVNLPVQTAVITVTPQEPTGNGFHSVSFALYGNTGAVTSQGSFIADPYQSHGEPPEGEKWVGNYIHYKVDYSEVVDSADVFDWKDDELVGEEEEEDDWPASYDVVTALSVTFTIGLTGVYRTAEVTEEPPATREFMSYADRRATDWWATDETSGWTLTADWGAGSGSPSGAYGPGRDEFVDVSNNVVMRCYPDKCGTDADIVQLSAWTFTGTAVAMTTPLYNPGTDIPDAVYNPQWGRTISAANYLTFGNGMLSIVGSLAWAALTSLQLIAWLPVDVTFEGRTGKFSDEVGQEYAIQVQGQPIVWTGSPPTSSAAPWTSTTDNRVTEQERNWLFAYEWQTLSSRTLTVTATAAWAATNGEVSADGGCPLILPPISGSVGATPIGQWPAIVTTSHDAEVPVVKPAGVTRPADWIGSGGAVPQAGDNDVWDVAASSSAPYVALTLASRFFTRLGRLADHAADTDYHDANLIILNYPNTDRFGYQVPTDFCDPVADRIDENEWHWKNHTYLRVRLWAPRAATLTVTVNFSTFTATFGDGPYTCFEHTFGTSGAFTYARQSSSVTYEVSVVAGWNTRFVDLMVPATGGLVPNLHHVDLIRIDLPSTGAAEQWRLDDLYLSPDPDETHEPHYELRCYDPAPYQHIVGTGLTTDFTMTAGLVDGKGVFDIPYGYDEYETVERSLKGRQKRRHCPDTPIEDLLDYAKPIGSLVNEMGLQRGWAIANSGLVNSSANKDIDGTRMFPEFYYFDPLRAHEGQFGGLLWDIGHWDDQSWSENALRWDTDAWDAAEWVGEGLIWDVSKWDQSEWTAAYDWPAAPVTLSWRILGGVAYRVVFEKHPQGRAHGLCVEESRGDRLRGSGTVELERQAEGGGPWVLHSSDTPDANGRYRVGPGKELGYNWRIAGEGTTWDIINGSLGTDGLKNRRYTTADLHGGEGPGTEPDLYIGADGRIYEVHIRSSSVVARYRSMASVDWESTVYIARYEDSPHRPQIRGLPDGRFLVRWSNDSGLQESLRDAELAGV